MKSPKKITQENIKRLMLRDGITQADMMKDFGVTRQNISKILSKGITDEYATKFADKYGWDRSEIYLNLDSIGKEKNANDILYDLLTQLNKDDKKTIARLMVRMLNRPKESIVIISQVFSRIDRNR